MAIKRLLRHLLTPHWRAGKAFPDVTMRAIEEAIAAAERETSGEIRLVVESALPVSWLLAGQSAEERALGLFADLHVWDTAENNGVLIYVLLAERHVALLADRAVNARVGTAEWQAICRRMEAAFAEGRFAAGACAAVAAVGQLLKTHFPPRADQANELTDRPLLLSRGRARRVAH